VLAAVADGAPDAGTAFMRAAARETRPYIDRWIGGVHLQGHHVPWRWDDGTETIVHLPAGGRARNRRPAVVGSPWAKKGANPGLTRG